MLVLRRGVVLAAGDPGGPMQELEVRLGGERRPAVADVALVGAAADGRRGDRERGSARLELGSGGFDIVHANLTRGLAGAGTPGAHVMKLNYTSLQHAVMPVEDERAGRLPLRCRRTRRSAYACLHGAAGAARVGVQARRAGGPARLRPDRRRARCPAGCSEAVRVLRAAGCSPAHVTAGPALRRRGDAITTAGALQHGFAERYWHAAVCGPGPGRPGVRHRARPRRDGRARDRAHRRRARLPGRHLPGARRRPAAPAPRHVAPHADDARARARADSSSPAGERPRAGCGRHEWRPGEADLDGVRASGLPARTMGRSLEEDPDFFAAALAAGSVLAQCAA